jgi:hypothetical protein
MSRLRAETMPAVTVPPKPKGLPMAITQSPTRLSSESPKAIAVSGAFGSDLQDGDVGLRIAADDFRLEAGLVMRMTVISSASG